MREIEITWFETNGEGLDIENVMHAVKMGFVHKIGEFEEDEYVYQFISKEKLNIDLDSPLDDFYSDEQIVANDLADDWPYEPGESIGSIITNTSGAFYDRKLDLPSLDITLVWN